MMIMASIIVIIPRSPTLPISGMTLMPHISQQSNLGGKGMVIMR